MADPEAYEEENQAWHEFEAVRVRPFRPEDAPAFWILDRIGHLLSDAADAVTAAPDPPATSSEFRASQLWVAEVDGEVIGTVGIARDASHVAELRHLRLDPEWRDRGIARRLVATAAREARESGHLKLLLVSEILTDRATQVMENLGFQYVGDRRIGGRRIMQFYLDLYRPSPSRTHPIKGTSISASGHPGMPATPNAT